MDLSIIICTSDRADSLRSTLQALSRLETPSLQWELLIIDNGQTEQAKRATAQVVEQARNRMALAPRLMHEERRGLSHARNTGLECARGDIALFTDDDIRPAPGWIEAMSAPILNGKAQVVAGGVRFAPALQRDWMRPVHRRLLAETDHLDQNAPKTMVGANMAFARQVLGKVPGFDVELGAGALGVGEETLFSMQLGEAEFAIAPAFSPPVEHHFDASRLQRNALLDRARKEGRAEAYLAYHWWHHDPRSVWAGLQKHLVERALWQMRHGKRAPKLDEEGCDESEMILEQDIAFYRQFFIERRRPRFYAQKGLIKCPNASNNAALRAGAA